MREKIVDFFEKLDDIKIEKRQLMPVLIALEIIGILVLVWYLRAPLTQKYLVVSPKTYSIVAMNTKSRYLIHTGDFLSGNTIPNMKVTTLITPGKIKNSVESNNEGIWSFKIPDNFKEGRYKFTVGYFDKSNKLTFFKTYNFRIASNKLPDIWFSKLSKISKLLPISVKKAGAQSVFYENTSFVSPMEYNLTILSIGSDSDVLNPGQNIFPQSLVYDQLGTTITEGGNLNLNYVLEGGPSENAQLIPSEDCNGIQTCSWRIPEDLVPGDYSLTAVLNINSEMSIHSSNSVRVNIGQNVPIQASDQDFSSPEDQAFSPVSSAYLGDCTARGKLFWDASKDGVPLVIPGYWINPETNDSSTWFDLRKYVRQDEEFCILGKYISPETNMTYQYKVIFDDEGSEFKDRGYFAVPIAKVNVVAGDLLDDNSINKNSQIGVRVNLSDNFNDAAEVFDNVDDLGVGTVRILLDEARKDEIGNQLKLIDEAVSRGYFIVLQYQPGERSHRSKRLDRYEYDSIDPELDDFDYDVATTYGRFKYIIDYLMNQKGLTVDRFAIELGNEPNVRWSGTEGKYFQDCARFRQRADQFVRDSNGKVIIEDLDPRSDECNPDKGPDNISNVYNAFADFIDSSSTAIWNINPDIKLIIGALFLQGGGDAPDKNQFAQENIDWFLGAIETKTGAEKFKRFDFAIHGYHVWNTKDPLKFDRDQWKKENDGLGATYYWLINNEQFKKYRSSSNCQCIWVTEFGIDQIGQNLYQLVETLDQGIKEQGNIRSIIIHEFNGEGADNVGTNYRLWSENEGIKYPAYNLIQYFNLFDNIETII